jgi:ribosomal protein L30E
LLGEERKEMPQIAERLTVLLRTGEVLLQRLSHTKLVLNDTNSKPLFLNDNNTIKVLTNVVKKFPELSGIDVSAHTLQFVFVRYLTKFMTATKL